MKQRKNGNENLKMFFGKKKNEELKIIRDGSSKGTIIKHIFFEFREELTKLKKKNSLNRTI